MKLFTDVIEGHNKRQDGWILFENENPLCGQYVQLFSGGVVQDVNPMYDYDDEGGFWHMHGLLEEDPRAKKLDKWKPLPEAPESLKTENQAKPKQKDERS